MTAGNMIGPGRPGQTGYLKRIISFTENLPEHGGPGFFWTADPKHVDFMVQWTKKRGGKQALNFVKKGNRHGSERLTGTVVEDSKQEEQHCTCRMTGQTQCLLARQQCNMFPNQTF